MTEKEICMRCGKEEDELTNELCECCHDDMCVSWNDVLRKDK